MNGVVAANAAKVPTRSLPTVPFGDTRISRLICGSNPFYGYSHFNPILSYVMKEWSTPERVCESLHRCEANGINTFQCGGGGRGLSDVQRYRAEAGRIHTICLAKDSVEETVRDMRPIGVAHHGEVTDRLFRAGEMDKVHEFTKRVRQAGVQVGVSTHNPRVLEYVEEKGWDVDFFMACAYHRTRTQAEFRALLGELPVQSKEIYLEKDPGRLFLVVRQIAKPCLVFKILAAGRRTNSPKLVDDVFRHTFENIKPNDAVIVGMYPRYRDEITENADRVRRILNAES